MKLFENKVGRPSNETLSKRRRVKILIAVAVIAILGACSFYTYRFVAHNAIEVSSKNLAANEAGFYISGNNGGFTYLKKYNAANKNINLGTTKSTTTNTNVFYFGSDGTTTFNIKGQFGKTLTKGVGTGRFIVLSYDSNNNILQSKNANILSSATNATLTLTASKNIHHIAMTYYKQSSGLPVLGKTIYVSTIPELQLIPDSAATKNSSGEYVMKDEGAAKTSFKITTASGHTMYYRWFEFKNYTVKSSNLSSTSTCVAFNKTTTAGSYSMKVNDNKAGMLRIYATKDDCTKDSKASYPSPSKSNMSVLKQLVVKYKLKPTTTNSSDYTVIRKYDISKLRKNIGSQTSGICFTYALKYGAYILGNANYTKTTDVAATYGATSYNAKSESELYSKIVENINKGLPVVIQVWNGDSPTHYVTVVGYKKDKNNKVDSLDDIWIVDPYPNVKNATCYGKKDIHKTCSYDIIDKKNTYVGVLYEGKASKRTNTIYGLHSSRRYLVWGS